MKEILLSNTFTVVPSLRYGIAQKNNADIQLVIDALSVAYSNELIDSFCIVSGDSDYTPLVGTLKSMGKFVLGISRSEVASHIFINACNEFQFLESVGGRAAASSPKKQKNSKGVPFVAAQLTKSSCAAGNFTCRRHASLLHFFTFCVYRFQTGYAKTPPATMYTAISATLCSRLTITPCWNTSPIRLPAAPITAC